MHLSKFTAVLTVVNLAILALLLFAAAQTKPKDPVAPTVVRAQAIELVDAQGNVRGQLYLGADGGGNIRLRSPKGEVRVKLGATDTGAGLLFLNKETEPAVQLMSDKASPSLTLTGPDKQQRVITP